MYTSHKQELIKGVYTDILGEGIRVLTSRFRRNFGYFAGFHFKDFRCPHAHPQPPHPRTFYLLC